MECKCPTQRNLSLLPTPTYALQLAWQMHVASRSQHLSSIFGDFTVKGTVFVDYKLSGCTVCWGWIFAWHYLHMQHCIDLFWYHVLLYSMCNTDIKVVYHNMMSTIMHTCSWRGGVYATGVGSDIKETYQIKKQVDGAYFSEVFSVLQSMEQLFLELQCDDGALRAAQVERNGWSSFSCLFGSTTCRLFLVTLVFTACVCSFKITFLLFTTIKMQTQQWKTWPLTNSPILSFTLLFRSDWYWFSFNSAFQTHFSTFCFLLFDHHSIKIRFSLAKGLSHARLPNQDTQHR